MDGRFFGFSSIMLEMSDLTDSLRSRWATSSYG
jgi:hypothetical protein